MNIETCREISWNLSNLAKLFTELAETSEIGENKSNIISTEKIQNKITKEITIEEIRAVLAVKFEEGKKDEVKGLLNKFGAKKLSEVKDEDYEKVMDGARNL